MVKFDVTSETGFLTAVEYLGGTEPQEVIAALKAIEVANLDWKDFVKIHGWVRVRLKGPDTYPGADPLYWFVVVSSSGKRYQIAGKGPFEKHSIVVCAAVLRRKSVAAKPIV